MGFQSKLCQTQGTPTRLVTRMGIDNAVGFLDITHALSLNDSLWVKKETAFETDLHGLKLSTTSPEFTSEGSFEKCWAKENDGIYFYKKGSFGFANAGIESYSEFYSSQLSSKVCKSFVSYDIVKL